MEGDPIADFSPLLESATSGCQERFVERQLAKYIVMIRRLYPFVEVTGAQEVPRIYR
jgi:hypothetical protein